MSVKYIILWLLPKNLLSRFAGWLVSLRLPRVLVVWQIKKFADHFRINIGEAAKSIEEFSSLQEFFIRQLKSDARPIASDSHALISPCDCAVGAWGIVKQGSVMQVKGRRYSTSQLCMDEKLARKFENGNFATLYLAPKDYHRFHAPCDAVIEQLIYVPGHLWPVNPWAVENIDDLFCINERIVIVLRPTRAPQSTVAVIAVGATMVGKIKLTFDETTSNMRGKIKKKIFDTDAPRFVKGQELGHFEFGSTIVLLTSENNIVIDRLTIGQDVKMGVPIGSVQQ